MSVNEEGHISELVAPYVLGALEPDEVEQVEIHLEECAMCRALVEEERRVVRILPYLAEPRPVPHRSREALLQRVREESIPSRPPSRWKVLLPSGRSGWIAAATAAVLALVFAVNSFQMQGEMEQRDREISERQNEIAEVLGSSRGWTASLEGNSASPGAAGGIIVDPTTNAAILVVNGLEQPAEGRAYVVWMVDNGDHQFVGDLDVDDNGSGQLYITGRGALANYDGLIVTEEAAEAQTAGPLGDEVMAATFDTFD